MTFTEDVKFRLQQLKNQILLTKDGEILIVKDWETEEKKTLFGKKTVLKVIKTIASRHIDTKWMGVYTEYLPYILVEMENSRARFKKMQSELEKFGYVIKGKQG